MMKGGTMRRPVDTHARYDTLAKWTGIKRTKRAERALELLRTQDEQGLEGMTEAYLLLYSAAGLDLPENTLRLYRRALRDLLRFARKNGISYAELDTDAVWLWVRHEQARGQAPGSINARVAAIRSYFHALAWCGVGAGTQAHRIHVKEKRERWERGQLYSPADVAKLLEAADPANRALVLLGADAGLRAFEIGRLRVCDVDFANATLTVVEGKGGKTAAVGMSPRLADALRPLVRDRRPEDTIIRKRTHKWSDGGLSREQVYRRVQSLCASAGVEFRGVHALRHTCGTALYAATEDGILVRRHMRHKSITSTEIYMHLSDTTYKAAVAALGA